MAKQFPHYRKNNTSDCGPTSLGMVANFYGMNYSAEMLRKHCHISRRGVNMLGISEGTQHMDNGYNCNISYLTVPFVLNIVSGLLLAPLFRILLSIFSVFKRIVGKRPIK